MKKTELSDKDKAYLNIIHKDTSIPYDKRVDILKDKFGKSERTIRRWLAKENISNPRETDNEQIRQGRRREYRKGVKYFLITWAQNATPLHKPFWDNLRAYAEFLDADISVIQGRYQNPTSLYSEKAVSQEWWDEQLFERDGELITFSYLEGSRSNIHKYVTILGDIRIVPTAENPLSSLEGFADGRTCIVGHPRIHLQSLPVLEGDHKKLLLTTGACTVSNYTESKSGAKGSFHHRLGAVIVEIQDDDTYYIRQFMADNNGCFTDLCYEVCDNVVYEVDSCAAAVLGDLHIGDEDPEIVEETRRLMEKIRPEKVVLHDIFNGASVNHHESKDPIKKFERFKDGSNLLGKEIDKTMEFISTFTDYETYVVQANHNDFVDRWIRSEDWKKHIHNAEEYLEFTLAALRGEAPKGIIAYLIEKRFRGKVKCLDTDESFKVHGWELGNHGHLGVNGAKGSLESFRRLNTKTVTAHAHSTNRKEGAVQVGTLTKRRLGYNKGASSWGWSNAIIHHDGKCQQIIFADNKKFTTLL